MHDVLMTKEKDFPRTGRWNTKKICEYFRVPSTRAGGGGHDQHQGYAALWQGGDSQRKAGGLMKSFRI